MHPLAPASTRLAVGTACVCLIAFAFCVAGSAAGIPPSAITGPVSAVTSSGATLEGTINPNGVSTTWSFQYGTTTAYGSQTTAEAAGSGTANTTVTAGLTGLTPGTTYHYRLDATSGSGSTQGNDGIFSTPGSAPAATTTAATNLTETTATLNGSVNPNGEQTSYSFQYGKTTSYGSSTPAASAGSGSTAVQVSAAVTGLQPSQTYHARLVATNATGTSDGPDVTFTLVPPPTVTTNPATSVSATGAMLQGTVDPSGEPTTWQFEYGTTTNYGSTTTTMNAGSGTRPVAVSATVTGLAAGTTYHFRLVATNPSGTSVGADRSFGSTVPPVVATGSAENAGPTTATLTGSVNPKGLAARAYFQYGTTTAYGSTSASVSAGSGMNAQTVSVPIGRLAPATTYHYRIVAVTGAGTSYGGDVAFTTPPAVTLVAETSQSVYGHAVTLSGTAAGAPPGAAVTILAQPLGQTSFTTLATVVSQIGGGWSYQARPTIATSYEASTSIGTSAPVAIGVRPAITLRLITGARFLVRVVGSVSFQGRLVKFQRLLPQGGWLTVGRRRLNARSAAVVAAKLLPPGGSTIRVAMSINETGRGFLAGFSRTLVFNRR